MPVIIMAVGAFSLAIWGLWAELKDSSGSETLLLNTVDQHLKGLSNNEDNKGVNLKNTSVEIQRQEIRLNFVHENSSRIDSRQKNHLHFDTKTIPENINSGVTPENLPVDDHSTKIIWRKIKIRNGDSMARIFQKQGFHPSDLHAIIDLGSRTSILKKVKPGKYIEFSTNNNAELQALRYSIDELQTLTVIQKDNQWTAHIDTKTAEIRLNNARGIIRNSLFLAGKKAGLTDAMVMELASIFGWDIDFILDIRENDQFTIIYEEKFVEGEKIANGDILAAEFINQGKIFKAVRYTDTQGLSEYFTPSGISMRKAFLRAPVDFSYISSSFNPRRYHPILKRVKAHNGVDYRAPKGTPVKAAGDGKVIVSAYSKYNGHHVFVQHGQKYVTKYLHFSKRKVRRGQSVKQGQIIGYVGATGLAQAPHLHYEFLVNGVHRNPRTIRLPDAKPINRKEKARFLKNTKELVKQLKSYSLLYSPNNMATAPTILLP